MVDRVVSIPVRPDLEEREVEYIVERLNEAVA
jgi:dTDP-4-amino-4,6-dideoxygalactose transaminase